MCAILALCLGRHALARGALMSIPNDSASESGGPALDDVTRASVAAAWWSGDGGGREGSRRARPLTLAWMEASHVPPTVPAHAHVAETATYTPISRYTYEEKGDLPTYLPRRIGT